jgi:nuclear GTP-binding protein
VSALEDPAEHVAAVLARARPEHVARTYGLREWSSPLDFLEQLARRQGRLLRGGHPDVATAARGVLVDWQSGRLPFFEAPPMDGEAKAPRDQPLAELRVDPALQDEPEELYRGRSAAAVAEEELDLEQLAGEAQAGGMEEVAGEDEEDEEEEVDFDELV